MCGEKRQLGVHPERLAGSPPRVRGKVLWHIPPAHALGITPACAGKRTRRLQMRQDERDHPRVCGEKSWTPSLCAAGRGSPPRVRGKGLLQVAGRSEPGITPACAGKSTVRWYAVLLMRDHPRVCGEKPSPVFLALFLSGSPPRVRGKVTSRAKIHTQEGITPACAGKSFWARL